MTEQNENTTSEEQAQPQGANISIEQILAAVLETKGAMDIPLSALLNNYSNKQISVTQDGDIVTFELVDGVVSE